MLPQYAAIARAAPEAGRRQSRIYPELLYRQHPYELRQALRIDKPNPGNCPFWSAQAGAELILDVNGG
ncbi:MAG: hypothetical protein ACR2GK_00130 [Gemmatimonadaceae bacterium]